MSTTTETQKTGNVSRIVNRLSQDQTQLFSKASEALRRGGTNNSTSSSDKNKKYCKARFSYAAVQSDELTFKEDEVIEAYEQIEDGWMKGKILSTQETGLFPTNFVQFIPESEVDPDLRPSTKSTSVPSSTAPVGPSQSSSITASLISSFKEKQDKATKRGTTAVPAATSGAKTIDDKKDEKNHATNNAGSVAAAVISRPLISSSKRRVASTSSNASIDQEPTTTTNTTSLTASSESKNKSQERALVLYSYDTEQDDELALIENTYVTVLDKHCTDDGWYFGEYQGKQGVFPSNFVKLVPIEKSTPATPPTPPPVKPPKPAMPVTTESTPPSNASSSSILGTKASAISTGPASGATKSKISDLQNKVFGNRLPPKPGDKPAARPVTTILENYSVPPVDSIVDDKEKDKEKESAMSHPTRDRPRQANKRPPSMMHVSTPAETSSISNGYSNHTPSTVTSFPAKESPPVVTQKPGFPTSSSTKKADEFSKDHSKTSSSYKLQTEATITPTKKAGTSSSTPITITSSTSSIPLLHGNEDEPVTRREYNQLVLRLNEVLKTCEALKHEVATLRSHQSNV